MARLNTTTPLIDLTILQQKIQNYYGRPITLKKTNKFLTQYVHALRDELMVGIFQLTPYQERFQLIPISRDRLRMKTGRIHKDRPILDCFLHHEIFMREVKKGNRHQGKTEMIPTIPLEFLLDIATDQEIADSAYSSITAETKRNLQELLDDAQQVDCCPLDIKSLDAYISKTQREQPRNDRHREVLRSNLQQALIFRAIASIHGHVPQIIQESEFGRRYYTGPNLQNCHRELRHAALGHCYQYDIKTAVFAWKLDIVQTIIHSQDRSDRLSYTLEYIDNRDYHRRRLGDIIATRLSISPESARDIIKRLFTAIGFGATDQGQGWYDGDHYQRPALAEILRNPECRRLILADDFVHNFIKEQRNINKIIFDYVCQHHGQDLRSHPRLLDARGVLKKNRVMAYLYQQQERQWIDGIRQIIAQYQPHNHTLLTIHDGLYTKKRACLLEMREWLRSHNQYSDIEETEIDPWRDQIDHDQWLQEHQQRIQAEESRAAAYYGQLTRPARSVPGRSPHTQGQDHSGGGGYDGTGWAESRYDPLDDPAVASPEAYAQWRADVMRRPGRLH